MAKAMSSKNSHMAKIISLCVIYLGNLGLGPVTAGNGNEGRCCLRP